MLTQNQSSQFSALENAHYNSDNKKKIVLHGLEEYSEETEDSMHSQAIDIFYEVLNVNLEGYIEDIKRIGTNTDHRPLEIELLSKRMASHILKNRQYFRNYNLTVTEYLDKNELNKRRELTKVLRFERKNGNHAVIRNNILYINGKEYTNILVNRDKNQDLYNTQTKDNKQEQNSNTQPKTNKQHVQDTNISKETCIKVPTSTKQDSNIFFREF